MKKIYICLFLIVVLFTCSLSVLGSEKQTVDLKSAVDTAREQNLELKVEQLNLKKAKLQYKKTKAGNLLNESRYNELEAEYSLAAARNTYRSVHDQLVKDTIQQYTDLVLAEMDLEIKEKKVNLEKLLLDKARAQHEIGDIGNVELLEQENAYKDAEFNLETARDDYQRNIKEFKTLLDLVDTGLHLSGLEKPQSFWEITEEEAVEKALKNSTQLQLKEEEIELAAIDYKRAEVSASRLDKEIKEVDLEISRMERDNTEEEITNSVQEVYYQFKQSMKRMNLTRERLVEAREKYDLRKQQYDAGLITKSDLLQYEINMMEADYQYRSTIAGYYLNQQSLRNVMNLETGVFRDESQAE